MPNDVRPEDKAKAEAKIEARKREDREALNDILDKYSAIVSKLSEASTMIGQIIDQFAALDRLIRQHDTTSLMLGHRLRIKVILGVVFPARQQIDRVVMRMKTCVARRNDMLADIERSTPAFE